MAEPPCCCCASLAITSDSVSRQRRTLRCRIRLLDEERTADSRTFAFALSADVTFVPAAAASSEADGPSVFAFLAEPGASGASSVAFVLHIVVRIAEREERASRVFFTPDFTLGG